MTQEREATVGRVSVVHSFYSSRQTSGENRAVRQQVDALTRAGYSVTLVEEHTDEREPGRLYALDAALTVASGRGHDPTSRLLASQPDLVLVHNLFPNFGRRWAARWPGAIVAVMHNYRTLCAAGTLFRDGRICTECLDARSSLPAVRHRCYRGSVVATAPLAVGTKFDKDPLLSRADRIVTLSPVMRGVFERAGVAPERLDVVPSFIADPGPAGPGGDSWLYVGRLTAEKGIAAVVEEWPADRQLLVVGAGPLRHHLESLARTNVTLLGELPSAEVAALMGHARGLVFPSRWYEGSPMVYVEALAAGTPVLAWEPSTVAAQVRSDGTGLVVNDLSEALTTADETFGDLRQHCRQTFEQRYSEAAWQAAMGDVFRRALVERKA